MFIGFRRKATSYASSVLVASRLLRSASPVNREQEIISALVRLANDLVEDYDVVELLHDLVERCTALLECDEVGLLLAVASGGPRVVASSSQRTDLLTLLQYEHEEGPCFECLARGEFVRSENLERDAERWPHFARAAMAAGFCSVSAIPMRVRGETVGSLNLLRTDAGRIADTDLSLGQGMADMAAIALLQQRSMREARGVIEDLEGALTSRVAIEQAKGVLAARAEIDVETAFLRLRRHAREENLKLSDVARGLLDGTLPASALVEDERVRQVRRRG